MAFAANCEIIEMLNVEIEMWFPQQALKFYDCGNQKLVNRHNKCLDNCDN